MAAGITAVVAEANAAVPPVKELAEAAREMQEAMDEAAQEYEETQTNMLATASVAEQYISRLEEIEAATGGNVDGNQEYHNILELLTRTIPELANSVDLTTNAIEGGTEALRQHTEAWKQDAQTQAQQQYVNSLYDEYNAVMTEAAENSIKLTQAQMKERMAAENLETAQARMSELWKEAQSAADNYYQETGTYIDTMYYLSDEYHELENSLYE